MSKKDKIRKLTEDGLTAAEIAEELDTSKSYVYKCRSSGNGSTEEASSEPSDTTEPEQTEAEESSEPSENLEFGEADHDAEERDLPEGDTDRDEMNEESADSLELDDTGGKSYDCGECGAPLEYLQKTCDECGARPAWSAIAK